MLSEISIPKVDNTAISFLLPSSERWPLSNRESSSAVTPLFFATSICFKPSCLRLAATWQPSSWRVVTPGCRIREASIIDLYIK